jgi:hypothetical protein
MADHHLQHGDGDVQAERDEQYATDAAALGAGVDDEGPQASC